MSDSGLIADLIEPNLESGDNRGTLLEVYCRRVFSIKRQQGYDFLHEQRPEILSRLGSADARAEFLLRGWLEADPAQWADWAEGLLLEDSPSPVVSDLCAQVAASMIFSSSAIEDPAEIDAAAADLPRLGRGLLSVDQEELGIRLKEAAKEALADEWWHGEVEFARQVARHHLITAVEDAAPKARGPLVNERSKDASWPIGEEAPIEVIVLRGWRGFAEKLSEEAYEEIIEAIPAFDPATQPELYAESIATAMVIRANGSFAGGRAVVRDYLPQIKAVFDLGNDYRPLGRIAAAACVALNPISTQLTWLLARIGNKPSEETIDAVRAWTVGAGRGPTATLIKELMPYYFATTWMPVLRECAYDEAPVLKRVREVMLEDGDVNRRMRFARSLQALGLRTKGGPDKVAKLIVDLLNPKRKKHRKNDLGVALVLCECLGPNHDKHSSIEKALRAYSKKWKKGTKKYEYTPDQYRAILAAGVELPEEYLSKKTRSGLEGLVDEARQIGSEVVSAISRLNPF